MKVRGTGKFSRRIDNVGNRVRSAADAAVFAMGNIFMTRSKELAPFREGDLRASGYVTKPIRQGTFHGVEIGHGGPAEDYAVVQHENLSYQHASGQAKYLETAMAEHGERAAAIARKILDDGIQGERPSRVTVHPTDPDQGE